MSSIIRRSTEPICSAVTAGISTDSSPASTECAAPHGSHNKSEPCSDTTTLPLHLVSTADRTDRMMALQGSISRCARCIQSGYLTVARPVTRGKGSVDAPLMLVGQAPGPTGKDSRRPFSGMAGRTLGTWLELAGFPPNSHHDPDLVFLTSVTRCFPGKSTGGKGDRMPSSAEVRLCRPYLDDEIALVRPRVVVALGRLAATELIGSAPLGTLIEQVIDVERVGVRFSVVTLPHPSGVSRWLNDPANRAKHEAALRRLGELVRANQSIHHDLMLNQIS